ncbi:sulfite exporter TauE/SafE family protein [Kocuria sp. cx-455]|uniref:sulfite exporter TauE/SafE family protein n=1 Tax=unclassified Candidatus Sulfotelmatobacter TaxID=2635724 RepID=UPI001687552E|nr:MULTISPECIES: sulfite exporter TauE/SafE family protein [unclassified Candidatus Sulfotelmatobacter]MBD2763153.1 sulfite exporter TauE/SafE family protein [Kocuria sp. cx-116]MBD2765871.1 sulfite exporter TauE/SafE family protein [Kocuria sp. cx-455]
MRTLILLALVGFGAQLVDGSLGMAYGVTSSTLLLAVGLAPASVSATVHLAEVGTTLASGVSHWKFGNIDWRVVAFMALPGGIAAFFGAHVLTLSGEAAAPVMSVVLLALGIFVVWRFLTIPDRRPDFKGKIPGFLLIPLAAVAGFMDAIGGGGWGPVGTPTLLASGKIAPRKVIGSIDTSEFVVSLGASAGFLLALGSQGINFGFVIALLIGGVFAAPIAAWLVRLIAPRVLAIAAGGLIIFTNVRTILRLDAVEALVPGPGTYYTILGALAALWLAGMVWVVRRELADRKAERSLDEPEKVLVK